MGRKKAISVISSAMGGRNNLSKICVSTHMLTLWENFSQFLKQNFDSFLVLLIPLLQMNTVSISEN